MDTEQAKQVVELLQEISIRLGDVLVKLASQTVEVRKTYTLLDAKLTSIQEAIEKKDGE